MTLLVVSETIAHTRREALESVQRLTEPDTAGVAPGDVAAFSAGWHAAIAHAVDALRDE